MVLTLEPLPTTEAHDYWRVYLAGRSDVPTRSLKAHLDRYLALTPEEQRTHFAFRDEGRIIGTVRILPGAIAGFSMDPAHVGEARAALVKAVDLLRAQGAETISASFEEPYEQAFSALGFRRRFARMRMVAATGKAPIPAGVTLRPPEEREVLGLARFLMDVYEGHLEQRLGLHVGSEDEWRAYVRDLLKGAMGPYMPDASFAAQEGDWITGAILMTHWMGTPLVAELGVAKDRRGRGLGRALLQGAFNRLADRDEPRIALFVTLGNDAAIRLYERMGFAQAGGKTVTARLE